MDDPTKVPPTEEETIPAMREEFERLAADAFRAAGKCAPWADFDQEPRAFEEQVGKFGRLLAEAVAARPRPRSANSGRSSSTSGGSGPGAWRPSRRRSET